MRCKQISKMESLNLRNTWVSFLNVSLKMHADVIAGRQINQTLSYIINNFMIEHVSPPCKSSLATSFISENIEYKWRRRRSEEYIPLCWWGCWRRSIGDWWGSGREECVSWSPVCPQFQCSKKRRCGLRRENLEHSNGKVICGMEPVLDADDDGEDSIVDVFGGEQRDEGAESECFTFAYARMRANRFSGTVLEGDVGSSELPLCYSSFFILASFSIWRI